MKFKNADEFLSWPNKVIVLMGMSGVGKTTIANRLRAQNWYHYSVDYRIGTRYMDEAITDSFKTEAMKLPSLQQLLRNDSIYISSNITFDNLEPLSAYLGKPGNQTQGGLSFEEYIKRQRQHHQAEISSMLDMGDFIEKSRSIYGYDHFVCDVSGSLCEVIDPHDGDDPVIKHMCEQAIIIYLKEDESHRKQLIERFIKAPKPMYYQEPFLMEKWQEYKSLNNIKDDNDVDPDDFIVWGFAELIAHRVPLYDQIAKKYGYAIPAQKFENLNDQEDFIKVIAQTINDQAINDKEAN